MFIINTNRGRIRTFLEKGNLVTGLVVGGGELHWHAVHLLTLLHLVCVVILNKSVNQDVIVDAKKWGECQRPSYYTTFSTSSSSSSSSWSAVQETPGIQGRNLQMKEILNRLRKLILWTNWESWDCESLLLKGEIVKVIFQKGETHLVCCPASGPELNLMFRLFLRMKCDHQTIWFRTYRDALSQIFVLFQSLLRKHSCGNCGSKISHIQGDQKRLWLIISLWQT